MPFDVNVETPAMRRSILAEALRHPLVNWEWNFFIVRNDCGTAGCAIGYALTMWPDAFEVTNSWNGVNMDEVAAFFDMAAKDAYQIFEPMFWGQAMMNQVTPVMVADRLDAITGP